MQPQIRYSYLMLISAVSKSFFNEKTSFMFCYGSEWSSAVKADGLSQQWPCLIYHFFIYLLLFFFFQQSVSNSYRLESIRLATLVELLKHLPKSWQHHFNWFRIGLLSSRSLSYVKSNLNDPKALTTDLTSCLRCVTVVSTIRPIICFYGWICWFGRCLIWNSRWRRRVSFDWFLLRRGSDLESSLNTNHRLDRLSLMHHRCVNHTIIS